MYFHSTEGVKCHLYHDLHLYLSEIHCCLVFMAAQSYRLSVPEHCTVYHIPFPKLRSRFLYNFMFQRFTLNVKVNFQPCLSELSWS
jgi:hypothetical protein